MHWLGVILALFFAAVSPCQSPVNGGSPGPVVAPPKSAAQEGDKKQPTPPAVKPPAAQPDGKPQESKPQVQANSEVGKPNSQPVPAKNGADEGVEEEADDEEGLPSPTQIPKSADPADIAAMQSAQAMLKAEARLKRLLKKGEIKGIDQILTFEEISSWPYQDGLKGMPEPVKKMDGKTVLMTGFMLPIDEVENIKEFLLVQSLWSCCYGQPPDINGIVRVVMKGDKRINYKYDPIKITGQFKVVASYEDGYCIDIYQLLTDDVEVIK
jgi:hypothetical protein